MPNIIIAIDGSSSSGKGTFAKKIASCLGLPHLDSGAVYRAVTLYGLRSGRIAWNGDIDFRALQEDLLHEKADISFVVDRRGDSHIFLGDDDVSTEIREMEVARNVSAVSALPFVRNYVDELLHTGNRPIHWFNKPDVYDHRSKWCGLWHSPCLRNRLSRF